VYPYSIWCLLPLRYTVAVWFPSFRPFRFDFTKTFHYKYRRRLLFKQIILTLVGGRLCIDKPGRRFYQGDSSKTVKRSYYLLSLFAIYPIVPILSVYYDEHVIRIIPWTVLENTVTIVGLMLRVCGLYREYLTIIL